MRVIIIFGFMMILVSSSYGQDHNLFTDILKKYVNDGSVDYKNLKNEEKLRDYLQQLSSTDPDKLDRNERLAFWINAYNAFTLYIINENYPLESITDLHTGGKIIGFLLGKTVWDKEFITIQEKEYSLNDIEHEILRKMNEPRIHFAIVCASISCPELRKEAFESNKIEEQLQSQTEQFLNDESRNSFSLESRKAYISKIFDWFDEDFGDSDENVLKFISSYAKEKIANDIKENLSEWDISYKDYDWNLNEKQK